MEGRPGSQSKAKQASGHLEDILQHISMGLGLEFMSLEFLTSSQVTLMQLVWGLHLEAAMQG